jgi:hypothetical protein
MSDFDTQLSPEDEKRFQAWKMLFAPNDSGMDYDLRGAFQQGFTPNSITKHWNDLFKKPNHPTFSDESHFATATPNIAGHWQGDNFQPPPFNLGVALQQILQKPGLKPRQAGLQLL